jgi:hypothetical protein
MINRRKHIRRSARALATIRIGSQNFTGLLQNISENGASIKILLPEPLPPIFTISIPAQGIERSCRLVWTDGQLIGVCFV